MKKLLFVLVIGAFTACAGESKEAKLDSAAAKVDSAAVKLDSTIKK